jgi:hypothetical protein
MVNSLLYCVKVKAKTVMASEVLTGYNIKRKAQLLDSDLQKNIPIESGKNAPLGLLGLYGSSHDGGGGGRISYKMWRNKN